MSEVDWGSEGKEASKPKKRLPKWLWFCGGGCLLAVIAGVIAMIVLFSVVSERADADKQWQQLEAILPCEERPTEYVLNGIVGATISMTPGVKHGWQFDKGLTQVQLHYYEGGRGDELSKQLAEGKADGVTEQFGPFGAFDTAAGKLELQGRSLPFLRFRTFEEEEDPSAAAEREPIEDPSELSPGDAMKLATRRYVMLVDITPENATGTLVMIYSKPAISGPLSDSEPIEFLSHFDLDGQK